LNPKRQTSAVEVNENHRLLLLLPLSACSTIHVDRFWS